MQETQTVTATTSQASDIAVTADAVSLIRAFTNGALFASTDVTLPSLCCLHLTAAAGTLTVEATDRYVASQETLPATGELDILVNAKDTLAAVKPLAAALKANARLRASLCEPPVITVTPDGGWLRLTLTGNLAPDQSVTVAVTGTEFPRRGGKMMDDYEAKDGADSDGHTTFNAANLLKLAKVVTADDRGPAYRSVRLTCNGSGKPAVARIGDSFRALVMSIRDNS